MEDSSETTIGPAADSSVKEKWYTEAYQGTLPCDDCGGIETTLALSHKLFYAEGKFDLKQKYLRRKSEEKSEFDKTGEWTTDRGNDADPDAMIVELFNVQDSSSIYYLRNGNNLLMLDKNMNKIKSKLNYTLMLVAADSVEVMAK